MLEDALTWALFQGHGTGHSIRHGTRFRTGPLATLGPGPLYSGFPCKLNIPGSRFSGTWDGSRHAGIMNLPDPVFMKPGIHETNREKGATEQRRPNKKKSSPSKTHPKRVVGQYLFS